jgi:hypothetical protein
LLQKCNKAGCSGWVRAREYGISHTFRAAYSSISGKSII